MTVPLKICYVIDNLSRAGTEMQLRLLLQHLDRSLITPYLCLLDGESEQSRELEPDDVTITRLGIRRLASTRAMRGARRFRKFLKQHQIQIVQSFFPDSTRFASPIAKVCGVSTVLGTRRNIGHWMTAWDKWIAKFYNRTCIDQVIANCEAARQSVIQQEGMPLSRVFVIPNGIDLRRFEPCQPWTPTAGQTNWTIGMVGNLREVKGPDLLIDAAKLLLGKDKSLQFIIAGEGNRELYQQRINEHGIQQHFCLNGAEKQIPQFLSRLDVAVLPSRAEGMPNAILEYMAAGRPIVATRVGGTAELLEHRNTGILVPPESPTELAAGIQSLLDEPSLAARLAEAARDQVNEFYDIQRISERHCQFYREESRSRA
ncbi:MAG: glycosyltransferase [Mariniblastus sp.]|nr:glycosyltransferase [Mariniblastus sp.]